MLRDRFGYSSRGTQAASLDGNLQRGHAYTCALFASMSDKRRFPFRRKLLPPGRTPRDNLKHFHDAAREYGKVR